LFQDLVCLLSQRGEGGRLAAGKLVAELGLQ
jgi:hypothetical protein